jgi:predicted metal-binding membrane protein
MTYDARELARVRNPLLLISAVSWTLLLAEPGGMNMAGHSPAASASLPVGWALMLVAMMSPVLIQPVRHIRLRSFMHRRARSTMLFVAGYAAIWMMLGGVLLSIQQDVQRLVPQSYLPGAVAALVALVWQVSPAKQRCLNRCHAHNELAAFGAAADFDALRFGIVHGIWCAGSCWALMLFPLLLPGGHIVAMAAVAVLIFSERLERPMAPRWRWRGPGKLIRILVFRTRSFIIADI